MVELKPAVRGREINIGDLVTIFYRYQPWGWCKVVDIEYISRRFKYILTIEELKLPHVRHYVNAKRVSGWKRAVEPLIKEE